MKREFFARCECGSEIFAWTTWTADPFDEDNENWMEIVMTYKPRGLRHRIQAFMGRYDEAVIMSEDDVQKLREFLSDVTP